MVMLTNPRTGLMVLEQRVENTSVGTSPYWEEAVPVSLHAAAMCV